MCYNMHSWEVHSGLLSLEVRMANTPTLIGIVRNLPIPQTKQTVTVIVPNRLEAAKVVVRNTVNLNREFDKIRREYFGK